MSGLGPSVDGLSHTVPPEDSADGVVRHVSIGIAYTQIIEETLICPRCGHLSLAREHFAAITEDQQTDSFCWADRCRVCEPKVSHMPKILARQRILAKTVI